MTSAPRARSFLREEFPEPREVSPHDLHGARVAERLRERLQSRFGFRQLDRIHVQREEPPAGQDPLQDLRSVAAVPERRVHGDVAGAGASASRTSATRTGTWLPAGVLPEARTFSRSSGKARRIVLLVFLREARGDACPGSADAVLLPARILRLVSSPRQQERLPDRLGQRDAEPPAHGRREVVGSGRRVRGRRPSRPRPRRRAARGCRIRDASRASSRVPGCTTSGRPSAGRG